MLFFSDDSLWGNTCGQNISTKSPTPAPGIIELASFSSAARLSLIPPPLCATPFNKNPANAPGYNNERENERQGSGSGMMFSKGLGNELKSKKDSCVTYAPVVVLAYGGISL